MHNPPRIFAFIQARLSSQRFPRKILSTLPFKLDQEITILDHIYHRLLRVLDTEQIVFLVPDEEEELIGILKSKKWNVFSGSLEDVRERYLKAAKYFQSDVILRLTGDNPFVETEAVEILMDAWLDPYCKADLMYVSGLPLGMSLESFRLEALESSLDKIEPRHKEHVSLAIKEDPLKFQISDIPFLSSGFIPAGLRITIDESKDREMLSLMVKKILEKNPQLPNASYISSRDILNLYYFDSSIFRINNQVEQIKFSLPSHHDGKKLIKIFFADPNDFGSGHRERMQYFAGRMASRGFRLEATCVSLSDDIISKKNLNASELKPLDSIYDHYENAGLVVWDIRDTFPPLTTEFSKLLLIDNFSTLRDISHTPENTTENYGEKNFKKYKEVNYKTNPNIHSVGTPIFMDLLPHPKSLNWMERPVVLIPNNKIYFPKSRNDSIQNFKNKRMDHTKNLLVYSGGLDLKSTDILDNFLKRKFSDYQIVRIGYSSSKYFHTFPRLTKKEWFRYLQESDHFLSYFGQSIVEAMYLQKKIATFSISNDHSILSKYLFDTCQIPYWGLLDDIAEIVDEKLDSFNYKFSKQYVEEMKEIMVEEFDYEIFRDNS